MVSEGERGYICINGWVHDNEAKKRRERKQRNPVQSVAFGVELSDGL